MPVKVKVKQTGRVKAPKLDNGQLTKIGNEMVAAQKLRWAKATNAEGNPSKPLTGHYLIIKRKYHGNRGKPKRDNRMTGVLEENFQLRKAINGVIRAENTTRQGRAHARRAQGFDEMIGFAASDQITVFKSSEKEYGKNWLKKAWIPIRG